MWFFEGVNPILLSPPLSLSHTHTHTLRSVSLLSGAGITLGVVASVLILLSVFSKFVPRVRSRERGFL